MLCSASKAFPHLISVAFEDCSAVTGEGINAISTACSMLTSVLLLECENITDACIVHIAAYHPQLTVIDVSLCPALTSAAFTAIASHCAELVRLIVRNNSFLDDAVLIAISTQCQKLETLNIDQCTSVTNTGVRELAKQCKFLSKLDITLNKQFSEDAIITVVMHRSSVLLALNLDSSEISDKLLTAIAEHCPNLQVLNLMDARGYTAKGLECIMNGCVKLQRVIFDVCRGSVISTFGARWWKKSLGKQAVPHKIEELKEHNKNV